ncbi:putative F-box protein At1g53370 isoform X2 [Silene latifolia]
MNKMVEGYFDRLPSEILHNIALMLPFNSIIELRHSSKFWYNLLTDPKFIDLHLSRALEKSPGYFLTSNNTRIRGYEKKACYFVEESGGQVSSSKIFEYSRDCFEPEGWGWDRFQSSGGLMCAYWSQSCCFRIFNPHIAEEVQIPRDSKLTRWRFQCFIFGYSPSIKKYKILKLGDLLQKKDEQRFCRLMVAEVCTLGSNIWREIQNVPDSLFCKGLHTKCQGNPFWMDVSTETSNLHFFDFVSEKFHVIPGPPEDLVHVKHNRDKYVNLNDSLISMGETIGYVHNNRLWVLEDKIKGIWINRYHFSIPRLCNNNYATLKLTGTSENGHLFGLIGYPTKAFVYDMGCSGYKVMEMGSDEKGLVYKKGGREDEKYMVPHVRSFVSPVRIMKMEKFSHKRKWILDTLKLDCDATDYDLINRMCEFLQAYEKDDKRRRLEAFS